MASVHIFIDAYYTISDVPSERQAKYGTTDLKKCIAKDVRDCKDGDDFAALLSLPIDHARMSAKWEEV